MPACAVFIDVLHVLSVCCVYRSLHVLSVCCVYRCPVCAVCVLCLQMPTCAVFTDILRVLFGGLHVHVTCGLPAVPLPPGTLSDALDFFLPCGRNSHSEYSVLHLLLFLGEIHPVNVLCTAFSPFSLEKFMLCNVLCTAFSPSSLENFTQ